MATTVIPTYTGSSTQQRIDAAKTAAQANTGMVNPAAIKMALAEQTFDNDQPLQQTIGGQAGAISAMDQLKDYDRQLAGQVNQSNQAQQTSNTALNQQFTGMGAFDPNNAQATIASGPATFDTGQIASAATPTGMISPFAASSLSSGQQQANVGAFDLASLARASREKFLGGEVSALADLYKSQFDLEREQEEREERRLEAEFNRNLQISQLTGAPFLDPYTGKTHDVSGKERNDNTATVWSEMLASATTEYDLWKQIDINQDALQAAGVDVAQLWAWHKNLADRVGVGGNIGIGGDNQGYIGQIMAAGKGDLLKDVPAAQMEETAKYLVESGAINQSMLDPTKESEAREIISLAQELKNANTKPITGQWRFGTNTWLHPFGGAAKNEGIMAAMDTLKNKLTLENIDKMKGVLSDSDIAILKSASTRLNNLKQSDTEIKKELDRIITVYQGRLGIAGTSPTQPTPSGTVPGTGYIIERVE